MGDGENVQDGTVYTVQRPRECDFCRAELPAPRNHNGIVPRFCPGSRCRSAWHAQEKRRKLEAIRALVDELLN